MLRYDSTAAMPIDTIEDLGAEIRTRESLDAAGQNCARLGHVWKKLETNAADGRPAEYCPICLRLNLAGFEAWPVWPARWGRDPRPVRAHPCRGNRGTAAEKLPVPSRFRQQISRSKAAECAGTAWALSSAQPRRALEGVAVSGSECSRGLRKTSPCGNQAVGERDKPHERQQFMLTSLERV